MSAPERRTIAFVNFTGIQPEGSWPATASSMAHALEQAGHEVIRIQPTGPENPLLWKLIQGLYRIVGMRFQGERQEAVVRQLARSVHEALGDRVPDLILCSSSLPIPFMETKVPLTFWTDATFKGMLGFYPEFSNMSKITVRNGMNFENMALKKVDFAVYSSDWAARSAIEDHGADPERVHVIPFGPNLPEPPDRDMVLRHIQERKHDECRLLFIGYDWERKQGPLAVKVHKELLRRGIPSQLTIVGCDPPLGTGQKGITVLGEIDKTVPSQYEKLQHELRNAHFLLVPSKAECYGMVYTEASAYGIPSVGCDVGGVSTPIEDGRNGLLLSANAAPAQFAERIHASWEDRVAYAAFANRARMAYDERLNWRVAVDRLIALLDRHSPKRVQTRTQAG